MPSPRRWAYGKADEVAVVLLLRWCRDRWRSCRCRYSGWLILDLRRDKVGDHGFEMFQFSIEQEDSEGRLIDHRMTPASWSTALSAKRPRWTTHTPDSLPPPTRSPSYTTSPHPSSAPTTPSSVTTSFQPALPNKAVYFFKHGNVIRVPHCVGERYHCMRSEYFSHLYGAIQGRNRSWFKYRLQCSQPPLWTRKFQMIEKSFSPQTPAPGRQFVLNWVISWRIQVKHSYRFWIVRSSDGW